MATIDTREVARPQAPPPVGGLHPAQVIALVVGILYLLIGLFGYVVTGFGGWTINTNEEFLGFDLNGFHNFVHVGVGLILILASMSPAPAITQGVLFGGGAVYVLAGALGFIEPDTWKHLLSIETRGDPDNFLHLFSGLAAIAASFLGTPREAPHPGGGAGAMAPGTAGAPVPSGEGRTPPQTAPPQPQRRW